MGWSGGRRVELRDDTRLRDIAEGNVRECVRVARGFAFSVKAWHGGSSCGFESRLEKRKSRTKAYTQKKDIDGLSSVLKRSAITNKLYNVEFAYLNRDFELTMLLGGYSCLQK